MSVLDAVIMSDLHLGFSSCHAGPLYRLFCALPPTQRLIVVGDLLEDPALVLPAEHQRVLDKLAHLSSELEVVWVAGNHDSAAGPLARELGIQFFPDEYEFHSGGRRILCVHGHQWDDFLTRRPWLIWWGDWIYWVLQCFSRTKAVWLKRRHPTFLSCVERFRRKAIEYAVRKQDKVDIIVCGHIHHPEGPGSAGSSRVLYCNCGTWADHHGGVLTVVGGEVALHECNCDVPLASPVLF